MTTVGEEPWGVRFVPTNFDWEVYSRRTDKPLACCGEREEAITVAVAMNQWERSEAAKLASAERNEL